MITHFPEPTMAWVQDAPFGKIYVEATHVGISRLDFGVPQKARELGVDKSAADALNAYFGGSLSAFDSVELDLSTLTEFRHEVVEMLCLIPWGETLTYKELAEKLGRPKGARAIGQAVGGNPVPIIAPCHRVLAAQHKLGGYSGGLDNKRWLLRHEGIPFTDN